MICFRDRSYCVAAYNRECINTACYRYFGPDDHTDAEKWWGGKGYPIAFADFHVDCTELILPPPVNTKEHPHAETMEN